MMMLLALVEVMFAISLVCVPGLYAPIQVDHHPTHCSVGAYAKARKMDRPEKIGAVRYCHSHARMRRNSSLDSYSCWA